MAKDSLSTVIAALRMKSWTCVPVILRAIWYAQVIHDGEYQSPITKNIFVENFIRGLELAE